ncbi:histone-lysine N-methyltransferase SETMAR [Plakobranchus ocellatus]|uniref:Histone-lysine N-methyltransferase SETMAR n=1 Tax=Plakobranchus ocellatus TaxID=259542 RepID=A0AAV4B6A6_9GAST|nr:histone-lysine N-methyltransferase SETMAR [Plakobranchus ocellatus]
MAEKPSLQPSNAPATAALASASPPWEGRTSLGDEPKSGRPKTSTNEENTTRVDELIRCDRRMKIREIALKLEIPKSTVHEIVHDTWGYRKVSARWVPKMLTEDHKLQRVETMGMRIRRILV